VSGFVYFIGPDWDHGRIKIGHTRSGVHNRLRGLQTGSPYPLKLYAFMEGGTELERIMHETFAPARLHGEWFKLDLKLAAFVTYLEMSGVENRAVTGDEFGAAMHDVMQCDDPPHPAINVEAWIDSADSGVLSSWECDRAWAEYQRGRSH
jgi:hypothetical protein